MGPGRVELKLESSETLEVSKRQRLVWDVQSLHKESQQSVLRELAELTAAWNRAEVDTDSVDRAVKTLEDMGLESARDRLVGLRKLEGQGEG